MVDVNIDGIIVPHTLIELGVGINVMTKETVLKINLQGSLINTTTKLQLVDRSTVDPKGVVEDVMVSIDSWEYPTDFLVLQPKTKFNGYPLIHGRPWLATFDSYISCRASNMIIKNGNFWKRLVLYPLAESSIEHDLRLWLEEEDEDEVYHTTSHPICTLDDVIGGGQPDEYDLIDKIIQTKWKLFLYYIFQGWVNSPLRLEHSFESILDVDVMSRH